MTVESMRHFTRHERGAHAEDAVCDYLRVRGFRITGRNVRLGPLELDVLAEKGGLAIVVEVRMRSARSWDTGFSSITHEKRRNLMRAVRRLWQDKLRRRSDIARIRIDVASVRFEDGECEITYLEGAIVGAG